ncbi:MAG: hypothetical protein P0Y48_09510 [Candidatus Microbacterium phytovorans]|uniref:Transporter substrate-binding domain-containing protein n=1 Tax=Candidatus Microbacterium phytovorans TaxID=3121374 RepID=A0AAJ5W151_9MICO|nr:hypothetical protein [Microbacterium sp.]WEK12706.1 MAG: hypothetical protein P0Y48_09510 [Microbacterium sp.]
MRRRRDSVLRILLASGVILSATTGCAVHIPTDPDGTLDRVTHGTLRVGVSPGDGLVRVAGGEVSGSLADLVEGFARERDAQIVWTVGGEEQLVDALEAGDLDLTVGAITDATPWTDRVSMTRGYPGIPGAEGKSIVVLLPLGENELQSTLESYLDERVGDGS